MAKRRRSSTPVTSSVNSITGARDHAKTVKHVSTVSHNGGPEQIISVGGTPTITQPVSRRKAKKEAKKVRRSLSNVLRASEAARDFQGLDPEQDRVLSTILRRGDKAKATDTEKLSAIETGLVESNLRNLDYGDADSEGWRQERTSIYGTGPTGPRNVKASADRFFRELRAEGAGQPTPGLAAQAAQGSAYPDRYDDQEPVARALLAQHKRPVVKRKDAKILKQAGINPKTVTGSSQPDRSAVPTKQITRLKAAKKAAEGIEKEQMPYLWGGGHVEGEIPKGQPLDCSAAVRAVLQRAGYDVPPMVAQDFMSFGKPGEGALTIYAKPDHVLMRVGNRFFGTSGSNPGGGAGWIEKEDISSGYLSEFTARHIPGLGKKVAADLGMTIAKAGGATGPAASPMGSGGGSSSGATSGQPGKKKKGKGDKATPRPDLARILAGALTPDVSTSDLERTYDSPVI